MASQYDSLFIQYSKVCFLCSDWLHTTYAFFFLFFCQQNLHKLHFSNPGRGVSSPGLMSGGGEQLLRVYSVTLNFKYPIIFDTV